MSGISSGVMGSFVNAAAWPWLCFGELRVGPVSTVGERRIERATGREGSPVCGEFPGVLVNTGGGNPGRTGLPLELFLFRCGVGAVLLSGRDGKNLLSSF